MQLLEAVPFSTVASVKLTRESGNHQAMEEEGSTTNKPRGGWAKVAYVQLVPRPLEGCGAGIRLRQVERGGSTPSMPLLRWLSI